EPGLATTGLSKAISPTPQSPGALLHTPRFLFGNDGMGPATESRRTPTALCPAHQRGPRGRKTSAFDCRRLLEKFSGKVRRVQFHPQENVSHQPAARYSEERDPVSDG